MAVETRDKLAELIAKKLNGKKSNKYDLTVFNLGEDTDSPTEVRDWISTGSSILDLAISNRPHGGVPVGKITELTGLEAAGKSLVAAHLLKNTQEKGGVAVYIDTESAVSKEFLDAIGVDLNTLLYIPLETLEEIYETMEEIITMVRESDSERLVTIVVDSLAAASTKAELEANFDKDGWATGKAIINSKSMRKITNMIGRQRICLVFTNQLRTKLGVTFGDPWTTSGGKAIPYHASVRVRLKAAGQIKIKKNGTDQTIGVATVAQVVKNRVGPPMRTARFEIYFDRGIDDYAGWLLTLKELKLVASGGAWYTYTKSDGTVWKFQSKEWNAALTSDEQLRADIYQRLCDALIMKYKSSDVDVDEIEITEDTTGLEDDS